MTPAETTHKMSELLYRVHGCLVIIEKGDNDHKFLAREALLSLTEFMKLELQQVTEETERVRLMVESNIVAGA